MLRVRRVRSITAPAHLVPLPQPGARRRVGWHRSKSGYAVHWGKSLSLRVTAGRVIRIDSIRRPDEVLPETLNLGLALLLTQRGCVVLHGGAVGSGRVGVVVMGSPGAGKSSLVMACARRGLEVISDEIVPLDDSGPRSVRCPGGNPQIRVDPAILQPDERDAAACSAGGKAVVDPREIGWRFARGGRRISHFIFLGVRLGGGAPPFRLDRLNPAEALIRALDHTYARRVLTSDERRKHLRVLANAIRLVPSSVLSIRDGLANLDAAACAIATLLSTALPVGAQPPGSSMRR